MLVFIITLFALTRAAAQLPQYQLNRIHEEGGLKTADVVDMALGHRGFLWVATQSQVQQFDGRHTLHFPFTETVVKILIDKHNRKWVLTRGGLYRFDSTSQKFALTKVGSSLPTDIFQTPEGIVCAIVGGKVVQLNENENSFVPFPVFHVITKPFHRLFGQKDGTYFFGSANTIHCLQQSKKEAVSISIPNIVSVIPISSGEAFVSTYQYRTYHVDFATGKANLLPEGTNLVLYSGVPLDKENFLLCSNRGLLRYHLLTRQMSRPVVYYDGRPLENEATSVLLRTDGDHRIFLHNADGIYLLDKRPGVVHYLRNYTTENTSLPASNIRNFAEDSNGEIWMATTNGLVRLNPMTGELFNIDPIKHDNPLNYPSYRQLLFDGDNLWIGTSGNGVWVHNQKSGTTQRPFFADNDSGNALAAKMNTAYVWKLLKLHDGRLLVVTGSSLLVIDARTKQMQQVPVRFAPAGSRSALQDKEGRIWHGTDRGLYCYDTSFRLLFTLHDSLPDKRVASFCEWRKNKMLVGSKGLFEMEIKENKIAGFYPVKAIPAERLIYCMKQDANGFVWLGTDEGLYRYDPRNQTAIHLEAADHVQTQAFNSDGAFLSSKGILFFGGKNGINYLNPSRFTPREESLQPLILSFTIATTDSLFSFPKQIPYSNRDFDFVISAPEFKKPFRIQYRYRLKNEQENWTYTGFNNRVRISSLPPDDYRLQVSASFDGKTWFNSSDSFSFTVLKPWWETGWFRVLVMLLILSGIWVWNYFQRRKKEERELQQMVDYFRQPASPQVSVDLILWDIAGKCISRLGFEDCVIYLLDKERNVLVQKAAHGAKSPAAFEIANPIEIQVGQGITGSVAKTGKSIIVSDTSKDQRYIVDDAHRLSELAVPILHEGNLIGVIDSEHPRKNFFTPHHQKTLEAIASLCASKLAAALAMEAAKKAETALQTLNGKMMESKFANLRLQMNPHFLFNILNTIQYLIISNQVAKATHYVDVFSGFLRSLLNHAEDTVVTLKEEMTILKMYVELESLCLDESFVWSVTVADEIDEEEALVPFMLLQPFVENAINHGLIHKPGEKRFSIIITEHDDESLDCRIEDNGIGRVASSAINGKNLSKVFHQSKGLGIAEERLQLLAEKTGKTASVQIEDLYQNETPAGTAVHLIIPYYANEEV